MFRLLKHELRSAGVSHNSQREALKGGQHIKDSAASYCKRAPSGRNSLHYYPNNLPRFLPCTHAAHSEHFGFLRRAFGYVCLG